MNIDNFLVLKNNITLNKNKKIYNALSKNFKNEVCNCIRREMTSGTLKSLPKKTLDNLCSKSDLRKIKDGLLVPEIKSFKFLLTIDANHSNHLADSIKEAIATRLYDTEGVINFLDNEFTDIDVLCHLIDSDMSIDDKIAFCLIFDIQGETTFNKFKEYENLLKNYENNSILKKDHEKEIADIKKEDLKKLKESNEAFKHKENECEDANKNLTIVQKDLNELNINYKKKVNELSKVTESFENLKKELAETNLSNATKNLKDGNKAIDESKISTDMVIKDLNHKKSVGSIDNKTIKVISGKWTVAVTPFVEMIPNVSYIDSNAMTEKTEYRYGPGHQKYLVFIDADELIKIGGLQCKDFDLMTNDDQSNLLFNVFCKKLISFETEVFQKGNKTMYNAKILKTSDYVNFADLSYIPIIKGISEKDFIDYCKNQEAFKIPDFPYTIYNLIKYVYLDGYIYKVDLRPSIQEDLFERCMWVSSGTQPIKMFPQELETTKDVVFIENDNKLIIRNEYIANKEIDYKEELNKNGKNSTVTESEFLDKLVKLAKKRNLCYTDEDLKNFHVSIKTSNLVILAGPSGLGKTRMPKLYADALNLPEDCFLFVTVNPSFTEPNDLLGYVKPYVYRKDVEQPVKEDDKNGDRNPNANKQSDKNTEEDSKTINGIYEEASSQLVSFLSHANDNPNKLHLVVFDEMNLAQIEYWFAPFMSALERDPNDRIINLYADKLNMENDDTYPSSIKIGENVIFVGTINLDETTKDISDRLLDRSIVLKLHKRNFIDYLNASEESDEEIEENAISSSMFSTYKKNKEEYIKELNKDEIEFLDDLHTLISKQLPEKGVSFRNVKMISNFVSNANDVFDRNKAFDIAICQTIIRKINGNENELQTILGDGDDSIIKLLDKYNGISNFNETRDEISNKQYEIDVYGFAR